MPHELEAGACAMKQDADRTKAELLAEVTALRARLAAIDRSEAPRNWNAADTDCAPRATGFLGRIGTAELHTVDQLQQPLTGIANYVEGCLAHLRSGHECTDEFIDAMQKASEHCGRAIALVRRFIAFRRGGWRGSTIRLNELVQRAVDSLEPVAREQGVSMRVEPAAGAPLVLGDRIQIRQVVVNLVRNGLEALGDTERRQRELTVRAAPTREGWIEVSVSDTGVGLPRERLDQLCEPFFTTKPARLGLGLAVCQTIVRAHGGLLRAAANPAGGAMLRFVLPVVPGRPSAGETSNDGPEG